MNPLDLKPGTAACSWAPPPFIVGADVAGVVEAISEGAPARASDAEAAALPTAGVTAWQALQIAKARGACVVGTARAEKHAAAAAASRRRGGVTYLLVEPDHRGLEAIAALVDTGRVAVHVSRTFPLAQAADAHHMVRPGTSEASSSSA